jgi:hypothetical protein
MMMYAGHGPLFASLKPETWDAWKRNIFEYDGLRYIGSFAPLFVHQYSQAFLISAANATAMRIFQNRHRHRRASPLLSRTGQTVSQL